jgi:hypothetical protein
VVGVSDSWSAARDVRPHRRDLIYHRSMHEHTARTLALFALLCASCSGRDDAEVCFLAAGSYELTFSLRESTCDPGIIVDQWTEPRQVEEHALRCGERSETKDKHISGVCFEKCTFAEKSDATSISGTYTCTMACSGKECRYSAAVTSKKL